MSNFGVKDTIDSLHQTIYDYLTTEYFGKNDALRECCKGELEKEGTLFRQAYIEANNAYKSIPQVFLLAVFRLKPKNFWLIWPTII